MLFSARCAHFDCWDEQISYSLYWWANSTILLQPFKLPMDLCPLEGKKADSTSKIYKNCSCSRNPFLYLLFFACSLQHHCLGFAIHLLTQLQPQLWTVVTSWKLTLEKKKKKIAFKPQQYFLSWKFLLGAWGVDFGICSLHELLLKLGEKGNINCPGWGKNSEWCPFAALPVRQTSSWGGKKGQLLNHKLPGQPRVVSVFSCLWDIDLLCTKWNTKMLCTSEMDTKPIKDRGLWSQGQCQVQNGSKFCTAWILELCCRRGRYIFELIWELKPKFLVLFSNCPLTATKLWLVN